MLRWPGLRNLTPQTTQGMFIFALSSSALTFGVEAFLVSFVCIEFPFVVDEEGVCEDRYCLERDAVDVE